jgi:hypothetical protein
MTSLTAASDKGHYRNFCRGVLLYKTYAMNRRKFLGLAAGTIVVAGVTYYLVSDKSNFIRADTQQPGGGNIQWQQDEQEILYLASLAPSGHNTQPWSVQYIAPYHWVIGNDKTKWLPAVDPTQRETILSIGAFLQNLEYAANNRGYQCDFTLLAASNQDEKIVSVKLSKSGDRLSFDTQKMIRRRTVRSHYLSEVLKQEDLAFLIGEEKEHIRYIPNKDKAHQWINEQTIEANRIQAYRDPAQEELANWIRFSSEAAAQYNDGLTTASMEITGIPAWILRNFYDKASVMKKGFREQSIDKVKKQVAQSAGWLLITSKDNNTGTLLETGKRLQRLFLKVRERQIALHPMTQILEEAATAQVLNSSIGVSEPVQFLLRTGYLKDYPDPVSLRRSVNSFVRI